MGLIALLDQYLNLVEMAIIDDIVIEYFGSLSYLGFFQILQGIYSIIGFLVFFISWLSDAYGRKRGLLVLILVMGIPAVIMPFTPTGPVGFNFFMILYGIVIMGTLSNIWEIPITEEAPPKKRGLLGSIAFLIGLIPIYAILAPRIASAIGWKWAYGIMGILMVICLILLYFMKEPERWVCCKEERKHSAYNVIRQLKTLEKKDWLYLILFSVVYMAWNMSFKIGGDGGKVFFIYFGMGTLFENLILPVAGILTMVGAITAGLMMDRAGRNVTMAIGSIGSVISYILLGFTRSPIFLWTAYICMPIVLAWIMVYFAEMFPTRIRATSVGVLSTTSRIGYVTGPILGGFILLFFPFPSPIYWIVGGLIMTIPLLTLLTKPYEAKHKTLEEIEVER